MTLRIGILGCGRIAGYFHAPILGAMPGVAVTALADPIAENRHRLAPFAPSAVQYADWRLPILLGEIDAVVICLPPALHAEAAIAAFAAGCHVYLEKPLALSIAEGRAILAAHQAAGTVGMIGLNYRFHPLVRDAKARVAQGEIGRVIAVRTLFTSARRALPGWKLVPGAGGDALSDLGTHDVDLVSYLTGHFIQPDTLIGEQSSGPDGSFATVLGRLDNGGLVNICVGQTTGHSARRIDILGDAGHLTVDLADTVPRPVDRPPHRFTRLAQVGQHLSALSPSRLLRRTAQEPSFAPALAAFVGAAKGGQAGSPDLNDGFRALQLVEVAVSSGRHLLQTPLRNLEPADHQAAK